MSLSLIVQSPSQPYETPPPRSDHRTHSYATLVADQLATAQIADAAAIALNAPVNGPAQHSGILGYHHCLVMRQALSGLSEEQALMDWLKIEVVPVFWTGC